MARKPKKKPAVPEEETSDFDDDISDDVDGDGDEEVYDFEREERLSLMKARDWRDVERYKEMRELRELVGDDLDDIEL